MWKVIFFILMALLIVPFMQQIMGDFTETGGMIETVATPFELVLWKSFALIVLVLTIYQIAKHIGKKGSHGE